MKLTVTQSPLLTRTVSGSIRSLTFALDGSAALAKFCRTVAMFESRMYIRPSGTTSPNRLRKIGRLISETSKVFVGAPLTQGFPGVPAGGGSDAAVAWLTIHMAPPARAIQRPAPAARASRTGQVERRRAPTRTKAANARISSRGVTSAGVATTWPPRYWATGSRALDTGPRTAGAIARQNPRGPLRWSINPHRCIFHLSTSL
ncbi:hypothetical protein DKT69_33735 [Micromonospora sicca]|uniref:Uncharacterized protein n=1 Tax=Micromonospora sicca TaxID=2202420 RepID=A0A317D0B7_9ACTN|nr:hypothetical protein DKT69_33735 [Micromonospora sp. 4G51]